MKVVNRVKAEKENCVELNIFVECDKCSKHEPMSECVAECPEDRHDDEKSCVKINVFVECEDKKHRYTI